MVGLVVTPLSRVRPCAPAGRMFVLMALAFGLLFGALACAAGMAGGVAHGAAPALDAPAAAHPDHAAPNLGPEAQSRPGGHADHSDSTSMAGSHPGMACVVSVDMHFPETSAVSISDSFETPLQAMSAGCSAEVDPPVPRFS